MKKHIIAVTVLQLAALTAFSTSSHGGIMVGGVEVTPGLQVEESHNDNIFAQETVKKSSWITTIDPALVVKAVDGANEYELGYRYSRGIFHSSHNDDYSDHFIGADMLLDLTSRLNVIGWADYNRTHDMRGTTFTGLPITFNTPDKYHETIVGSRVEYGQNARVEFSGEYSNKRYDNHRTITQTRDLDTIGGIAQFSYPIAPKTSAVIEARYTRFNYKFFSPTTNLDSAEQRYYAGLDWEATAKTTGTVRVGYLSKNFSNAALTDSSSVGWELGILWEPLTYSSWTLEGSSTALETDGTGSYTKSVGGSLTWNHEWAEHLSHTAMVGYHENKFQGLAITRKDQVTTAGASVNYELMRWLTVGAGYNYADRNSNAANASYRQNVWSLTLTGTL